MSPVRRSHSEPIYRAAISLGIGLFRFWRLRRIETGVDIDRLIDAAAFISNVLGRKPVSRSGNALMAKRVAKLDVAVT